MTKQLRSALECCRVVLCCAVLCFMLCGAVFLCAAAEAGHFFSERAASSPNPNPPTPHYLERCSNAWVLEPLQGCLCQGEHPACQRVLAADHGAFLQVHHTQEDPAGRERGGMSEWVSECDPAARGGVGEWQGRIRGREMMIEVP